MTIEMRAIDPHCNDEERGQIEGMFTLLKQVELKYRNACKWAGEPAETGEHVFAHRPESLKLQGHKEALLGAFHTYAEVRTMVEAKARFRARDAAKKAAAYAEGKSGLSESLEKRV